MKSAALLLALSIVGCAPVPAEKPPTDSARVALCGPDEPGKKLAFRMRILDYQGKPLGKAAVVAHQADQNGLYVPKGAKSRVPRIQGAAISDSDGWIHVTTIWPGPYPTRSEPAHIHTIVTAPEHRVRFVTFWFEGDPLITDKRRQDLAKDPETRLVKPIQRAEGVWTFDYDVRLEES